MKVEEIKNICNLGTGTMGFGTALFFAMKGYNVRMYGRSEASIERGFNSIKQALETYKENNLVTDKEIPETLSKIIGCTTLEDAAKDADFVIESIAEDLEIKKEVWAKIERLTKPETIFATNSSGLSPTAIAEALTRKEKFVVAHFWNPPHLVPLVEVVPGKFTSEETVKITWELIEKIGKKPVALKREALGFIGNRLQLALLREALYIVESGIATQEAVDTAVKYSIGRRLSTTGPLETADLGGLDIFHNIAAYLYEDLCDRKDPSDVLKKAVAEGNLGSKTGTGLYQWTPDALAKIKKTRENILIEWLQKDVTTKF
ncbi:3-hydroxyacyl-CoA dehydrogenase family protein [Anaerosinus massiliensis]|uniref:3-hydroxyacyl-CoA dehydrogenase family protein n=1 Tax=Massilibacillus massiliensis TaxID=1806837 RepID=UPI000AA5C732|nr:3-hydroxyacyl-CoA dehydrogenase family protein [Massilibacillus massiliensis]